MWDVLHQPVWNSGILGGVPCRRVMIVSAKRGVAMLFDKFCRGDVLIDFDDGIPI